MTQRYVAEQLFAGNSEMAALMRLYDWSQTPLGAVEQWSQSLKTSVRIMLTCRQPMFVWWGDALINLYNDAYCAILGGKHPEALGKPASVVWQEIWEQVGPRAESALVHNEGTYDEALQLIMERNGYPEETYYTFSYSPVPDDQGKTSGIICANTDDTQRVIGERQLALLRELAARTADARTFDDACTLSAICLETNPYDLPFAIIYLIDPEKQCAVLAGTSGIEQTHPAVPKSISLDRDEAWRVAKVSKTNEAEVISDLAFQCHQLPTGAWDRPPHQAVVIPIAPSGRTGKAGILVIGLNPFRLYDDYYQGFLNLVAAQISASVANAQAYEEERKRSDALAEIDQAKTIFFSNVSHEFRTPLTLMLSPLEELTSSLEERLQPDEREQLHLIQRNGLRLQKLVNTLLDFSRIEAGRVQAAYEPTDLASFTAELASVFRSLVEQAGVALHIDCPPLPGVVYVDRDMWEKIVLNLLSNAFKFTFSGSITVRLRAVGETAVLSVEDTGVGIPEGELPQLFKRFHRVSGMRSRTYEGSGIGLALVQELVKLHGGTIHVTSQVDRGTTFTITLPFGSVHLPHDRLGASRTLTPTTLRADSYVEEASQWLPNEEKHNWERRHGHLAASSPTAFSPPTTPFSARILLVDDNVDMQNYVKRLLNQYWHVETAQDGVEALEIIARQPPDLVLSDVMMPNLDGFGLLHALRNDTRTKEIPFILLSARAGEESRIEGLEAGADDYLTKPFSARELLARVESNLKLAQLRQKAAQQEQTLRLEVQAAKDNLEHVLSRIGDQFIALDREWCYTYANDRVTEVTGIKRENLIGQNLWDLFPDTIDSPFHTEMHRAMEQQTPVQFEYFYPPLKRWFENRVYPSAEGVSMIITDITDRKQTEAALYQSEERYRYLAEMIPQLVWTADTNGVLIDINQRWSSFTGLTLSQAQAGGWQDIVHPDDLPNLSQNWAAAQQGVYYRAEGRMRRADGAYRWHLHEAIPLKDENGQVIKWFGTATDIEARKQLEHQRQYLLEQEQAAREQAETANRIKDEFLAVLSHELRSPLNPILGWSKLLRAGKLDTVQTARALETIERNAKLQTQLIEDLLDVSRILQGKLSLNIASINLVSTIEAALETVRLAAEAKAIQIQTMLDPSASHVLGDPARLQQVLWNLLTNAVKFTPEGGQVAVQLSVLTVYHPHPEVEPEIQASPILRLDDEPTEVEQPQAPVPGQRFDYAQIQVTDTGKGIHPDFLPYVFEYFRQEDGKTTRKFGGLGLGLAIVRHLVELHGGTVQAESLGEGQGATFTVKVPLAKERSRSPIESTSAALSASHPLPLAGLRLLVVDDDADARNLIAFTLEESGAIVTAAASATEALQIFAQAAFDLLISDIAMPKVDGYMLLQQVRAMPPEQGGDILAIALTAYAGEQAQQQAIAAGFQKHIAKPVEPNDLVDIVRAVIEQKGKD
ncbi:MAG: ATP-binding protein [Leptolyngbya sp. BL-A-14]